MNSLTPQVGVLALGEEMTPEEDVLTLGEECVTQDGRIIKDEMIGELISVEEDIRFPSADGNFSLLHNSLPSPLPRSRSPPWTYSLLSSEVDSVPPEHYSYFSHEAGPAKNLNSREKAMNAHDSPGDILNGLGVNLAIKRKVTPFVTSIGKMTEAAANKIPYTAQVDLMQKFLEAIREVNYDIALGKYQMKK